MAVYRRGETYWYSFIFAGRRIQESAKTHSKTVAKLAEKKRHRELEESFNAIGKPDQRKDRMRTVAEASAAYQDEYKTGHAAASIRWVRQRLAHVERLLGTRLVAECDDSRIRKYIETRQAEGAANRAINMELENLSRAIGGTWRELWPKVPKLEQADGVGQALSETAEASLRDSMLHCESIRARTAVFIGLNTGVRSGAIRNLQWKHMDFTGCGYLRVGKDKTKAGRRDVPMNSQLRAVLDAYREWYVRRFGEANPEWYVLPAGQTGAEDPSKPIGSWKTAWNKAKERAGVECRFHDLRHTVCTKMAEGSISESTMLAIMGHMSKRMLETYSHIRMKAKEQAVEVLEFSKPVATESTTRKDSAGGVEYVTN
jgi:integrase